MIGYINVKVSEQYISVYKSNLKSKALISS